MRQIQSKINIVGKIKHWNRVPLLAHVSHGDCHYLVYEFMKNGSLQDVLDEASTRISNFGLAKVMPDANIYIIGSNVAGTVGYIAPEYLQTQKFIAKFDIYSFGVLLGVLVIGKKPTDLFFHNMDEICLAKWLWNVMASDYPLQQKNLLQYPIATKKIVA